MAVQDPPLFLQSDAHPAKFFRQMLAALTGVPLGAFSSTSTTASGGGGHAVVNESDLLVVENGTPNMSVNVGAGRAFVHGTEGNDQAVYLVTNDAVVNVAIATADATNPRNDIVVVQVRDVGGGYSGSSNDARLFVVTGTPAGSPVDPALPVNSLPLARVNVPANDTAITNGQITDLRRRARALGGIGICTSTTRPTGVVLYQGLQMWETDTKRVIVYDGTGWLAYDTTWVAWSPTFAGFTVGNGTSLARYRRTGSDIELNWSFKLGTTSAVGTTNTFTVPSGADAQTDRPSIIQVNFVGSGQLRDDSAALSVPVIARVESATTVRILSAGVSGANVVPVTLGAAAPWTWANLDSIDAWIKYPMASPYV